MLDKEIKEYASHVIGQRKENIRVTKIVVSDLNYTNYNVIYDYRDEDGILMQGSIVFNKIDFEIYLRKLKLKKLNEINV